MHHPHRRQAVPFFLFVVDDLRLAASMLMPHLAVTFMNRTTLQGIAPDQDLVEIVESSMGTVQSKAQQTIAKCAKELHGNLISLEKTHTHTHLGK